MSQFTPDELTQSSAIHGDFDHASLNYSGHQNMILRAESDSCQNCESPSTQTTLIVNKYGDEHEYKFCGDGCEGQYMRENKMSYDAEEDTILAQLYEIEDMENPSEEDLRNYRNLEIRYGELTRMDAEANAVIVSGSVDGEPAMFSYEKGTKDELGFTPGRITTGENVKELGYGYDVDSPELTFDRFQKGFKNYKNNVWRKHYMRAEEGNAPIQDPMEFGEMANWTPLDGSEGLKRKRAEDDILNKYLSDDSPDQFTQQEYDRLISMNGYGDDNFDMAQAVLEIAGNRKRAEDDYDDYLFCEGCGEERKSVGPDSVFKIDNAREDVLDDGNVLCDRCHTRGYKIKRDAESFSAEYSGPSTLSSALSGARKTGRSGKHLTIVQRLVAKYGIDKGVKIYKHFGIKQKRASPKVRGKTRGTKSGPRRYSEGRVGGAGRSQVYQKGDRTGSWTPSGGHTTRFANSGKAWYQERGLGTPVAGPIPDTDLAGKAMGEKSRGSFVNPHGIVGYPFVPAQQRERKSKK